MVRGLVNASVAWDEAFRVTSWARGAVDGLASLADNREEFLALLAVEALTNPLAREVAGSLASIPPERLYAGPEAGMVMTPFVLPRESRFSDGLYGMLYAGAAIETALHEVAHHHARRLRSSSARAGTTLRVFSFGLAIASDAMADVRRACGFADEAIYDPEVYDASRRLGRELRGAAHDGVVYDSVRHDGGTCVGLFWPSVVRDAKRLDTWLLYYDGDKISTFAKAA